MGESRDSAGGVRRRTLLASAAAGAAGLAGCLSRFRTARGQGSPEQVSLDILTLPGDENAVATELGRTLSENLETVGVDTEVVLLDETELRRQALIGREYDLFVSKHPDLGEPDALRPLLHSSFTAEIGWQNPFDFTNIDVDELLAEQRQTDGVERQRVVTELQEEVVRQQPFVPVVVPDNIRATRSDRFGGWEWTRRDPSVTLMAVDRFDEDVERLRLVSTNDRLTRNLNPLAIEYRDRGTVTGLLYDSLGRQYQGAVRPWAAEEWEFEERGSGTVATVTLRPDLLWHDGEPLTAGDVVFTVEFLQDTSLGELEVPVPAPQFRGRSSLVGDAETLDDRTVELTFPETTSTVAERALTLPILPREEWEERSEAADIAGIELAEGVTDALVWANTEPVGSGPLVFDSRDEGDELVLRRFDEHFVNAAEDLHPELEATVGSGIAFEELTVTAVRSDGAALQLLGDDAVDAVLTTLDSESIPQIGRDPTLDLRLERSRGLYLVGCNTAREPLGNPHFRRLVARLLDKETLVRTIFGGFGTAAASPLTTTEWLAPELQWNGEDPELPFLGTNGRLDVETIRDEFRELGFEYSDDGKLLQP